MADGLRAEYERVIAELRSVVEVLRATVEQQAARIAVLEKAAGQDSSNSSKPPSSDGVGPRKKRAEQRAAGRRPGKQPGSPGAHLRRRDSDETVTHRPVACDGCGMSPLEGALSSCRYTGA